MSAVANYNFWIGLVIFIATAVGHGTVQLTDMIPAKYIPAVKAWLSFISLIGTGYLTGVLGLSPQVVSP